MVQSGWSFHKFKATVANDIWPETLFFTLIAVMVTLVTELTPHKLVIANSLLTVLGTVLGLVISFRTSSAYERYQDGRKLWTNIAIASRNLGQLIWVHVSVDRIKESDPAAKDPEKLRISRLRAVIEKRSMVNLVQAFSVSVKHFLRAEPGIYYDDLYPLLSFLPKHATETQPPTDSDALPMWLGHAKLMQSATGTPRSTPTPEGTLNGNTLRGTQKSRKFTSGPGGGIKVRNDSYDPEKALPQIIPDVPLRGARNPPKQTMFDYVPFLLIFKPFWAIPRWIYRRVNRKRPTRLSEEDTGARTWSGKKRPPIPIDPNVPLEITLFLHSYLGFLLKNNHIPAAVATGLVGNLSILQDTVHNLERVRSTPIPFAYQAHLRMSLWLYLLFLPFQVVQLMTWFTIPGTCFASFLLLGFLEIGAEIENPFNYDENDLDLDEFCLAIMREMHEITAHPGPDPDSYVFSFGNQPFAPADCRNAQEILGDVGHEYHTGKNDGREAISRTLLRSWKQVEQVTRPA